MIPINVFEHRAQTNINRVIVRIVQDCITSRSVLELAVLIETPVVVVAVLRLLLIVPAVTFVTRSGPAPSFLLYGPSFAEQ